MRHLDRQGVALLADGQVARRARHSSAKGGSKVLRSDVNDDTVDRYESEPVDGLRDKDKPLRDAIGR